MTHDEQPFWQIVQEDARAYSLKWQGLRTIVWAALFHPEFYCVFWYRVNCALNAKGYKRLSHILRFRRQRRFGNDLDPQSHLGSGLMVSHLLGIIIGKGVTIGKNARIQQNVTIGTKHFTPHPSITDKRDVDFGVPRIGNNVSIGTGAVVVGNITIGDNVTIGALSFITCDIPSNSIAYGVPPNRTIRPA